LRGVLLASIVVILTDPAADAAQRASACAADAKRANLDFVLKDVDNRNVKLADYRGKVILLNFWATWCVPCRTEIPWFNEFQQTYGPRGFQALGVSADDTLDKLKPFVSEMKMTYPVLQGLGRNNLLDTYGVVGLPVTVLIAGDGRICARHTGMVERERVAREVEELLSY
jgi:cytochrome c biogenesis protein CcmG/thiol:disulfide interchange protein DsbE